MSIRTKVCLISPSGVQWAKGVFNGPKVSSMGQRGVHWAKGVSNEQEGSSVFTL